MIAFVNIPQEYDLDRVVMQSEIELSADSKESLNLLIDGKLKEGYLLRGGMQHGDDGSLIQIMILPNNIDGEVTLLSGIKLVVFLMVLVVLIYMIVTSF